MGIRRWRSYALAVLIGIPMYSNAAGIIPVVQALLAKGAALGTVLAFMMAVIGLSLPETIILRKVLRPSSSPPSSAWWGRESSWWVMCSMPSSDPSTRCGRDPRFDSRRVTCGVDGQ